MADDRTEPFSPARPISTPPNRNNVPTPDQTAAAWSQLTAAQKATGRGTGDERTTVLPAGAGDRTMAIPPGGSAADQTMPISTAFGLGASGNPRQPFGQPPAPAGVPSSGAGTYGSGSGQPGAVPQQRADGGGYGSLADYAASDMTMPMSTSAVENSGSLTGHILAQGWRDTPDTQRKSNVKVIVAMLVVLLVLVGVSLAFLLTVGDAFSNMIGGVFKG
ncbi:hypothetical protein [Actinoplanes sp. N902-109]|uniref:hypothetical protein n=1 Tax=Actinoplanes sp. (strain N902-109) TaxID=649831 RepID=UPI0012F70A91|nr:hypothetical protein [Actinoplanes sp. N902-109]